MKSYVRLISDDTELFTYLDTALSENYNGVTYKLGDIILNLLDLDIDAVKSKYTSLLNDMIEPSVKADDAMLDGIRLRINGLDEEYPELWFHTHLLYYSFGDVFDKDFFSIDMDLLALRNAEKIFGNSEIGRLGNEISKDKQTISLYYEFIAKVLIEDIVYWKKEIQNTIGIIFKYGNSDFYKELSPAQRLYFLDRVEDNIAHPSPFTFTDYSFKIQLVPDDQRNKVAAIAPEERAEKILKADVGLSEAYVLNSLHDFLQFELIKFILADLPLLKCQNCGRIFIPRGRPDVKYCDKVAEGETLPCEAIGATRVYQHKVAGDPIFKAYNRAYKRMNSRVKYKTLTHEEFRLWSDEARVMREKCINGEMSLEEFNDWLGNKAFD